jgi:hypothetical protein
MEKLNIKKLSDIEVKEEYQIKISHKFAILENPEEIRKKKY